MHFEKINDRQCAFRFRPLEIFNAENVLDFGSNNEVFDEAMETDNILVKKTDVERYEKSIRALEAQILHLKQKHADETKN